MAKPKTPAKPPKSADKAVDEHPSVKALQALLTPEDLEDLLAFEETTDFDNGPIEVSIKRLPHGADMPLPSYQTENAAGMDLCAAVPADAPLTLAPGARALVPTGFALQIPPSFEGQVRPRSGLALKHGVTILNAPGTIDADYRGEVGVLLINHGSEPFVVNRGDRIAQLVFAVAVPAQLSEVDDLETTSRGKGGWGSTGKDSVKG